MLSEVARVHDALDAEVPAKRLDKNLMIGSWNIRAFGERLAFVFDLRRVRPSGLACELVLSDEELGQEGGTDLIRQFARTPYAVSFVSGGRTFILVTLHVLWGKVPTDRIPELRGIAEWVANWADELESWGQDLIALGDFNIDRKDDMPLWCEFAVPR